VSDMERPICWLFLTIIVMFLMNSAVSEPISSWHPSAREFFENQDSDASINITEYPIIPSMFLSQNQSSAIHVVSSALSSESSDIIVPPEKSSLGRILVRYNMSEVSALAITSIEGVKIIEEIDSEMVPGLALCNVSGITQEEAIDKLSDMPGILYAEPDYIWTIDKIPDDPQFWRQWGMQNTGQTYREGVSPGTSGSDGKLTGAWDISTDSGDVKVAVLDTGIDYTHPDLVSNMWTGQNGEHGYDVINQDYEPMDDNGHGTHCGGIIGAVGNNGIGTTGVVWKTKLVAIKAINELGGAYTSDIIKGIEYSSRIGADIVSCSFGGPEYSQAMFDAISGSSALFVCAAGNNGQNNDIVAYYPSSYSLSNIIGVASTTAYDSLLSTSNFGTRVHLAAPGDQIYSTSLPRESGDRYMYMNGTSQASAMVAGMAALMYEKNNNLTPQEIRNLLIKYSDPVSSLSGKIMANGRVNLTAVLYSFGEEEILNLHPGWNYISVPRPLAKGSDTASIFAGVSSGGHSVLTYVNPDGWKTIRSTDTISIMTGYWIYSTKEDTIPLTYQSSSAPVTKEVTSGWNTFGVPVKEPVKAKDALSQVQHVWKYAVGFNATLQQYETPIMNEDQGKQDDNRMLTPKQGYWLYCADSGVISG